MRSSAVSVSGEYDTTCFSALIFPTTSVPAPSIRVRFGTSVRFICLERTKPSSINSGTSGGSPSVENPSHSISGR